MATHWYGDDVDGMGLGGLKTDDQISKFTDSVASVLKASQSQTLTLDSGKTVSARIDGYDVDVEENSLEPQLAKVMSQVRSKLDAVSKSPPFYVSITPASTTYLGHTSLATSLNSLNMQNYDGGTSTSPQNYLDAIPGLKPQQLAYGMTAEKTMVNTETSLDSILSAYKVGVDNANFAGLWMWRLNSDNSIYESAVLATIYEQVHSTVAVKSVPTYNLMEQGWNQGGRDSQGHNGNKTASFNTWSIVGT